MYAFVTSERLEMVSTRCEGLFFKKKFVESSRVTNTYQKQLVKLHGSLEVPTSIVATCSFFFLLAELRFLYNLDALLCPSVHALFF